MRNLISIEDVSPGGWDALYSLCCEMIDRPGDYIDACRGKVLATLFYEPSTRTNFSFQSAMQRLGGSAFGFAEPNATSVSKGETLADTVRIAASYADAVVLRSPLEGAALAASLYCEIPLINAGDGGHHHPTQTLTDMTTIARLRGGIGGMTIGICGDLRYGRTVHSLILALSKFADITYYLISPRELRTPGYILSRLRAAGARFFEVSELTRTLPELDVLYMTRIQRERFGDPAEYDRLRGTYVLDRPALGAARGDMLVMHPLPRLDEIAPDVDGDPRAVYFEQVRYGMYIRMALLLTLTGLGRKPVPPPTAAGPDGGHVCPNPDCVTRAEPYIPRLRREDARAPGRVYCEYCDSEITRTAPHGCCHTGSTEL
ncbi:MAG: aspartate carbamoyltransferase [Oscillospiraceae bacterium]|jgi:aspartate carbamoyltransferase catalytic subunit|nr:aspartate carbamoyltransferase [Oscillospiraceae bacterium]